MPLSSFLLKPMQRITRYPLLIKNVSNIGRLSHSFFIYWAASLYLLNLGQILENTPESHADHAPLREALERAEELCFQVNEGVREKENSDRLEWMQNHVQCEGPIEVHEPEASRSESAISAQSSNEGRFVFYFSSSIWSSTL